MYYFKLGSGAPPRLSSLVYLLNMLKNDLIEN